MINDMVLIITHNVRTYVSNIVIQNILLLLLNGCERQTIAAVLFQACEKSAIKTNLFVGPSSAENPSGASGASIKFALQASITTEPTPKAS